MDQRRLDIWQQHLVRPRPKMILDDGHIRIARGFARRHVFSDIAIEQSAERYRDWRRKWSRIVEPGNRSSHCRANIGFRSVELSIEGLRLELPLPV